MGVEVAKHVYKYIPFFGNVATTIAITEVLGWQLMRHVYNSVLKYNACMFKSFAINKKLPRWKLFQLPAQQSLVDPLILPIRKPFPSGSRSSLSYSYIHIFGNSPGFLNGAQNISMGLTQTHGNSRDAIQLLFLSIRCSVKRPAI